MLNEKLVGKRYPEQPWTVTAEAARAYALSYNDPNPRFVDEGSPSGPVAPPMYAVVACGPSELLPLFDEELTGPSADFFRRMVRGDNDVVWSDVIRPGDRLASSAVVTGIEKKSNGELLRVDVTLRRDGREVARVGCGYFVRGDGPREKGDKAPGTSEQPRGPVIAAVEMPVAHDQPIRYAETSGDRNPIHTDDNVARLYGHPGIILQGSCTMAFVSKAVLDSFCGGDPARLKRLRVRYARPVLPNDVVTTIAWRVDDGPGVQGLGLESKKQDGTIVIKNAFAEVAKG